MHGLSLYSETLVNLCHLSHTAPRCIQSASYAVITTCEAVSVRQVTAYINLARRYKTNLYPGFRSAAEITGLTLIFLHFPQRRQRAKRSWCGVQCIAIDSVCLSVILLTPQGRHLCDPLCLSVCLCELKELWTDWDEIFSVQGWVGVGNQLDFGNPISLESYSWSGKSIKHSAPLDNVAEISNLHVEQQ